MRRTVVFLVLIMMVCLSGCAKKVVLHNYTFIGENDYWKADYRVNGSGTFTEKNGRTEYNSNSEKQLTVTYKKDLSDLSSLKQLQISFQSSASGGTLTRSFDDGPTSQKTFTLKSSSMGGAIESKDEIIKVNIDQDGEIQTIELKNQQ